jgi:uncharacterized protein
MSSLLLTEVLGRGWAFPPHWDAAGVVALVEGEDDVREAMLLLLRTALRERVMQPTYGVGIDRYVFAEQTAETRFRLQEDVLRALIRFEQRIVVERVAAESAAGDESRIDVLIQYRIDPHRRPQTLVFPFYLQREVPV